jgi:hypothetical protein
LTWTFAHEDTAYRPAAHQEEAHTPLLEHEHRVAALRGALEATLSPSVLSLRYAGSVRALLIATLLSGAGSNADGIEPEVAVRYFADAKAASDRDGKRLWGTELYGPTLFFMPDGTVVANQADAEGKLRAEGPVWVGALGNSVAANTSIDWAGVRWAAIGFGALDDLRQDRVRLIMHESFHRVQQALGFPTASAINSHLEQAGGRIWLEYEWRALERALLSQGAERTRAVSDALAFRAFRRKLYAAVDAERLENALESSEGLAEYTGVALAADSLADEAALAVLRLKKAHDKPTFVRSFAYVSGPAYGALLDARGPSWRKGLRGVVDLGALLGKAYGRATPTLDEADVLARAGPYGDDILWYERRAEKARATLREEVRAKYVDGPVLTLITTESVEMSFNPNTLVALDASSTLYPSSTFTDEWGTVTGDVVMVKATESSALAVPAVVNGQLKTGRVELKLKPGWVIGPGKRAGDQLLQRAPPGRK